MASVGRVRQLSSGNGPYLTGAEMRLAARLKKEGNGH
jgi:hypothetical protein